VRSAPPSIQAFETALITCPDRRLAGPHWADQKQVLLLIHCRPVSEKKQRDSYRW
jgi:hypothetical protein